MKVVMFNVNWWNPKQLVIGLFTWSGYCHAGLLFDRCDVLYDASESRGNVDWHKPINNFGNQKIRVYEIPENETFIPVGKKISPKDYALGMKGQPYDWKGIAGWFPFLASNNPRTVYCFELVLQTLLQFDKINGVPKIEFDKGLSDLLFQKPIDSELIELVFARCGLKPIYEGKAKNYEF